MTDYAQGAGKKAKHGIQMVANQVDKVTFVDKMDLVTITPVGAAVFVRFDGQDPAVNGDFSYIVPDGWCLTLEPDEVYQANPAVEVRLKSAGTPVVSVQRGY